MGRKPDLTLRQIAEVAVDYETTGQSMRDVAERHGVSAPTVARAVATLRQTPIETRQFNLQRHFADVLLESSEAQLEAVLLLRDLMRRKDFVDKLGGRDIAAIVGTLAKENRATFDYVRRTFGDRIGEPAADEMPPLLDGEPPPTHEA